MARLSADDFNRLQNQLLELREKNYTLEDSLRKHMKELAETRTRFKNLSEENDRYQTLVKTSKKASEVELLMRDNSYLRNKLRDQEEDFRLQNNTLLQELSRLVGENERYERQVELLCGNRSTGDAADGDHGCTDDSKEVVRLRGELTVIEKKLYEAETKAEADGTAMKEKIATLNLQITQLTNVLKTHSIPVDEGEISLSQGGGVSFKKLSLQDDDGLETHPERPAETLQYYQEKTSQLQHEVVTVNTQLREESERASSLKIQKEKLENDLREACEQLAEALAEAEKKSREKENKETCEAEERLKEVEAQLREELETVQNTLKETKENLVQSDSSLTEKTTQCDSLLQAVDQLKEKLEATEKRIEENEMLIQEKESKLEGIQEKVDALTEEISNLLEEKEALVKERDDFQLKVTELSTEGESQRGQIDEQTKLAESRKNLIEEMKAHLEEEAQRHKQEVEQLSVRHGEEIAAVSMENQQLKAQLHDVNEKLNEVMDLKENVRSLESQKSQLQEENSKLLGDLEAAHKLTQEEINRVTAEKLQEMQDMRNSWNEERKDLQTQLEISNIQRQESEEAVEALKRKVSDGEEEQRIHERKGMTLLKDLKKQLAVERKRADRLQEKLSQLLTDPAQLTAITTMSEVGDDVSSVSSWSMVSGEPRDSSTRENSIIASPQGSPPPGVVTEETASLVNRLTDLQQQKWQLEERITHLESSCSAMADDLLKKSAIIQHYCMDQKVDSTPSTPSSPQAANLGEKLSVRRMLEVVRGHSSEESTKEINRRLQGLLEETLSKNMQLHQDVDNLSEQVHQLSILAAQKTQRETSPPADA
ncbi:GRIP1-associated protein 1-like isoform X2 [Penaeus japonicus]|uniref:GRIP1-associated protein 1-like isoform X2 n=1 Tax=Penaeus japonicus TaxID=27405 RepID=UPI001C70BC06|nr:GRIP1-associated protein 1-like isoform X2 [Penaeus japonicus]